MICNTLKLMYMKEIQKIQNGPKIEGNRITSSKQLNSVS